MHINFMECDTSESLFLCIEHPMPTTMCMLNRGSPWVSPYYYILCDSNQYACTPLHTNSWMLDNSFLLSQSPMGHSHYFNIACWKQHLDMHHKHCGQSCDDITFGQTIRVAMLIWCIHMVHTTCVTGYNHDYNIVWNFGEVFNLVNSIWIHVMSMMTTFRSLILMLASYSLLYTVYYIIHVGPYQQAPDGVTLTDIRLDQLTFSWSQIDPNCPTVQYQNTSDCGSCSLATPTSTLANCYDLQLSTIARNCTFSVRSEICGFSGPSSNPITVTLKGMLLSIMLRAWTRLCFIHARHVLKPLQEVHIIENFSIIKGLLLGSSPILARTKPEPKPKLWGLIVSTNHQTIDLSASTHNNKYMYL